MSRNVFEIRRLRIRRQLKQRNKGLPRLTVFKSNQYVYAQVIDDFKGVTLAAVNTLQKEFKSLKNKYGKEAAKLVGKKIAEVSLKNGIKKVVFDKGGYKYHGKVKELADAAREGGLIV